MWFPDGVLYPVSIFSPFANYRCAIAGKKLMRKHAYCTTAVTTNVVTAIAGDREDLSRVNITMPVSDAAPTMMVIAISKGEKCPLMMLAIPSTYSQMNTIKVNQNRKRGSPIQPVRRARRIPNAIPIQSGRVCTTYHNTRPAEKTPAHPTETNMEQQ